MMPAAGKEDEVQYYLYQWGLQARQVVRATGGLGPFQQRLHL